MSLMNCTPRSFPVPRLRPRTSSNFGFRSPTQLVFEVGHCDGATTLTQVLDIRWSLRPTYSVLPKLLRRRAGCVTCAFCKKITSTRHVGQPISWYDTWQVRNKPQSVSNEPNQARITRGRNEYVYKCTTLSVAVVLPPKALGDICTTHCFWTNSIAHLNLVFPLLFKISAPNDKFSHCKFKVFDLWSHKVVW